MKINFVDGHTKTDAVYTGAGTSGTNQHWDIVNFSFGIYDIGKQPSLTVFFFHPTAKLPTDQRVQFSIFIDRPIDANKQTRFIERFNMVMQIRIFSRAQINCPYFMNISLQACESKPPHCQNGTAATNTTIQIIT